MSEIYRERGDLAGAIQRAGPASSSASSSGCRRTGTDGGSRWRGYVKLKAISTSALDLLDEADIFYVGDYSPNVRPVPALRARLSDRAVASGRKRWAGHASRPGRRR